MPRYVLLKDRRIVWGHGTQTRPTVLEAFRGDTFMSINDSRLAMNDYRVIIPSEFNQEMRRQKYNLFMSIPSLSCTLVADANEVVCETLDNGGRLWCLDGRLVYGDKDCLLRLDEQAAISLQKRDVTSQIRSCAYTRRECPPASCRRYYGRWPGG